MAGLEGSGRAAAGGQGVAIAAGAVPFDITVTVQASQPDMERYIYICM